MITITHADNGCYSVKPCLHPCTMDSFCSCSYALGWDKPNYPMPAIANQWALAHPIVLYMWDNNLLAKD